jgi:hypothetical protein
VLVSGGDRLTEPLASALTLPPDIAVIRDPRGLAQLDQASLSATVTDKLHAQHAEHEWSARTAGCTPATRPGRRPTRRCPSRG